MWISLNDHVYDNGYDNYLQVSHTKCKWKTIGDVQSQLNQTPEYNLQE